MLPLSIQAIQVLIAMQQRQGEIARLYTARYEIMHYRANQLTWHMNRCKMAKRCSMLVLYKNPWEKSYFKKMHLNYRPRTLREAFDLMLEFEKEYQVTQPQSDFTVMETCYEDPEGKHDSTTEEVWDHRQINKVNISRVTGHSFQSSSTRNQRMVRNLTREINSELVSFRATNLSTKGMQTLSRQQTPVQPGISRSRSESRSRNATTQDRFWNGTTNPVGTGTVAGDD